MSKKGFTYTLQIDAEINDLIAKTAQVRKSMQSIMDAGKAPGAERVFTSIEKAIERLQTKASQPIESVAAFQNLQKDAAAVGVSLGKLGTIIENLGNMGVADKLDLLPPNLKKQIEDASSALAAFSRATAQAEQKSQDLADAESQLVAAQKELKKAEGKVKDKQALVAAQATAVKTAHEEAAAIKEKLEALKKYQATVAAYEAAGGDKRKAGGGKEALAGMNLPADRKAAAAAAADPRGLDIQSVNLKDAASVQSTIDRLTEAYRQAGKTITDVEATQRRYNSQLNDANNAAGVASGKVTTLTGTVAQLNAEFQKDKAKNVQAAYTQLRNEAGKLGVDLTNIPLDYTEQNFNELNTAMNQLVVNGISQVDAGLNTIQSEMGETATSAQNLGDHMNIASGEVEKLDATVSSTTAFTERIKQFVGLQGGIQLARTAMRNAISTIKELDKAMTEMAVVTEFEVGDYWDQLPEYTARANALGVSIKSAYESATLYYQQGLKTNEVVAMSNETLKMARIAGLSAEDATNKMTAALRGFNMELNETSAQRVADVYSELAAITASDVDEISSAMTKTASIAASAGMEFETTAAFLSQIIETTRESAETAGTALKTVIARFQELKKDPSEIGEVDGEIVDANKIETALRTVGVSLRDAGGQFRELDEVFLELSGKWDSLDTNTQRYIATIAAGSRQQSRFIAMMSDYSRTQELVAAANSSAGASNEQFEKTMDSLESKLNELKNAWDSFTMGIMNSDLLKAGIDLLTGILTAINNITDAFGDFSGAAKIGLLVAALYLGDKALKVFMGSLRAGTGVFGAFGATGRAALDSINKKYKSLQKLFTAKLNIKIGSDELARATSATKAYSQSTAELQAIEAQRTAAAKAGTLTTAEAAVYSQQAAEATARQSAAEKELMTTMGLSAAQLGTVSALEALGVSTGEALILTKAGLSAATLTEISAINGKTVAENASTLAQNLSNASGIRALSAKIGLTVANWAQTASENAKTGSLWASVTATIAQTMANWGLQASMWPILVIGLLVVAAFAALVAIVWLLIKAFKAWKANSPEGKLKAAQEASKSAAEAAEMAADAYNNLADSLQNVADKYAALENITRGTEEWRKATKAVNDEVLNLIDRYPELAQYVESINGVLTLDLDSQEVAGVLQKYEKQMSASSNAALNSRIKELEAALNVTASDLQEKSTKYEQVATGVQTNPQTGESYVTYTTLDFSLSQSTIKQLATAVANGEVFDEDGSGSLKEELEEWISARSNLGYEDYFASTLNNNIETLRDFGNEIYRATEEIQLYTEQMAQSAISTLDQSKFTEQEITQMQVAGTSDFTQQYIEPRLSEYGAEEDKKFNDAKMSELKAEVATTMYGKNATVSGNTITYYDENGDPQTEELSDEDFKSRWAAIKATQDMAEAFEQLPKTINKISAQMSSEVGKAFKAMYAGKEGSAMTKADIEAAGTLTQGELVTIWNNLTEEEKKAYGSFEQLQKQYNDSVAAGNEALIQAQEASTNAGIALMEGVTMEAARGYAKQMRNVYLLNEDATDDLQRELDDVIGTLNEIDKTNFLSALNALDWQSAESLESLPETLEQMGISVPNDELDEYIDLLKQSAGATRKIDIAKIRDAAVELMNLKGGISKGEQGRSFSAEAYEALKEMAPELADQFQLGLDGQYTYLGSSMAELTAAIEENTIALMSEATKELSNKMVLSDLVNTITADVEGAEYSFKNLNKANSEEAQREALKLLQQNMKLNNAEIVGIEGFGNNTAVDKLSGDELDNIISQLSVVAGDKKQYEQDLNKTAVEAAAVMYQSNSATQNAFGVDMSSQHATLDTFKAGWQNIKTAFGFGDKKVDLSDTYRHSTAYKDADQNQKNEFDARSSALMSQATQTGVSAALVNEYAKVVEAYKAGKKEYSEVLKIQRELANSNDYLSMRNGMKGVFEMISGVSEEYQTLADADVEGKITVVNQALARFGIQMKNGESADKYMEMLDQLSQGNTDAMNKLVIIAQEQAGLSVAKFGSAYADGWDNLSQAQIDFYDQMAAASMGHWKLLEDGTRQFVWATVAEMESIAEAAGTAIEEWENPYTWLYNYNEEINRLTREREKAERDYTRALEDESLTAEKLLAISKEQLSNLEAQAQMHATSAGRAMDEIQSQFEANSKFSDYVTYDAGTNEILIDYEGLENAGFDEETGEEFEEFISAIEENRDVIIDAEDALYDIEDQISEIKDRGKEETSELYNQIKEGLITSRQQEIDELQAINDSVQEASASLVDQMQKQIDEARQARENEKTENDISDKETRLAYLMRDTSGGNAMEIAALQKEIAEQKEGYTDSLVDQQLQSLQDANEQAAQQRQQQIDIAQAQLDAYANGSAIWQEVQNILMQSQLEAQASGEFSTAWMETSAAQYIAMAEGINSLNPIEQEIAAQSMLQNAALSTVYSGVGSLTTQEAANAVASMEKLSVLNSTMATGNQLSQNQIGKLTDADVKLLAIQNNLSGSSPLVTSLAKGGALDSDLVNINNGTNNVMAALQDKGVLSTKLGSLNGSLTTTASKTQSELTKNKTAIDNVKTSVKTLGTANITPGVTSITKGAGTNTQSIVKAISGMEISIKNAVTGGGSSGSGGSGGTSSGSTKNSSGSSTDWGTATSSTTKTNNTKASGSQDVVAEKVEDKQKRRGGIPSGYVSTAGLNDKEDAWFDLEIDGYEDTKVETGKAYGDSGEFDALYKSTTGEDRRKGSIIFDDSSGEEKLYVYGGSKWYEVLDQGADRKSNYDNRPQNLMGKARGIRDGFVGEAFRYETGGLADYTGPAWLDGTKSKPEIVLNQTDSANFMQLRDILADILQGTSGLSGTGEKGKGGDNYFDIEINVESITDDYDVEQLADKIRNMIYEDSTYRNVNSISGLR